tara:strand:- start:1539 stop:1787 length:249 start_codon:yes stop_codon:yes gene_type:complete
MMKFEYGHFKGHICTYKYKLKDGNIVAIDITQVGEGIDMRWEFFKDGNYLGGWDMDGEELPTHARVWYAWVADIEKSLGVGC